MPWKECHVVDERLGFIIRLLEGEPMTAVCGEFGISRKTGCLLAGQTGRPSLLQPTMCRCRTLTEVLSMPAAQWHSPPDTGRSGR